MSCLTVDEDNKENIPPCEYIVLHVSRKGFYTGSLIVDQHIVPDHLWRYYKTLPRHSYIKLASEELLKTVRQQADSYDAMVRKYEQLRVQGYTCVNNLFIMS